MQYPGNSMNSGITPENHLAYAQQATPQGPSLLQAICAPTKPKRLFITGYLRGPGAAAFVTRWAWSLGLELKHEVSRHWFSETCSFRAEGEAEAVRRFKRIIDDAA
jgi:hypothetical protein